MGLQEEFRNECSAKMASVGLKHIRLTSALRLTCTPRPTSCDQQKGRRSEARSARRRQQAQCRRLSQKGEDARRLIRSPSPESTGNPALSSAGKGGFQSKREEMASWGHMACWACTTATCNCAITTRWPQHLCDANICVQGGICAEGNIR